MPADSRCPDFHQDGAFLGDRIRTVDCWIALSDCGPGTGAPAIDLVARRLDGVLETGEGSQFPWTVSEATARAVAGDTLVSPVFAPGDALFFDERLLHRTSTGPDVAARYAIESWFFAPSAYPDGQVPIVW
jgi:ectoine hydroxylase-related dioxygenase (phytanoyl-CoA dioxygenase family)